MKNGEKVDLAVSSLPTVAMMRKINNRPSFDAV
jgi:hypothetical protein